MTLSVLYRADPVRGLVWAETFRAHAPDFEFHIWPDTGDSPTVECLIAWEPPAALISTLPNLRILFSSGTTLAALDLDAEGAFAWIDRSR